MAKDPLKFSEAHRSQSGSWSDGCLLSLDPALHWPLSPSVSYITSHIRVWLCFAMNMEAVCYSANAGIRLLTHTVDLIPSWQAHWFWASQEIPCILWNPKVRYSTHNSPLPVPLLSQIDPDHACPIPLLDPF